jgi:hypothetical protein
MPDPWVPAGHFYSPIVDPGDQHVRQAIQAEAQPTVSPESLGLDSGEMLRWFAIVSRYYESQPFPENPSAGTRYHYGNANFPLADALALLAILRENKPRRYIEVGCGYSSCAAIDINEKYLDGQARMTFIDPHPETLLDLLETGSPYGRSVLRKKVQDVGLELFQELQAGDVLFIDSSHVAKTGSDVLDYLFRILPALAAGVFIHIHDIFYPFEYPAAWIVDQNRSWNEAYLLRAFLQYNPAFRVIFLFDWFYKCRRELLEEHMPLCVRFRGGSLWLEKRS